MDISGYKFRALLLHNLAMQTVRREYATVQGVSIIVFLGTTALPHKKPASDGKSCDGCRAQ
jgi:hypothetical protein